MEANTAVPFHQAFRSALRKARGIPSAEEKKAQKAANLKAQKQKAEIQVAISRAKEQRAVKAARDSYYKSTGLNAGHLKERVLKGRGVKNNRVQDLSECTQVRLDAKTTIYVRPGKDIDEVIRKYRERKSMEEERYQENSRQALKAKSNSKS